VGRDADMRLPLELEQVTSTWPTEALRVLLR
jgi:hypothetical protein